MKFLLSENQRSYFFVKFLEEQIKEWNHDYDDGIHYFSKNDFLKFVYVPEDKSFSFEADSIENLKKAFGYPGLNYKIPLLELGLTIFGEKVFPETIFSHIPAQFRENFFFLEEKKKRQKNQD